MEIILYMAYHGCDSDQTHLNPHDWDSMVSDDYYTYSEVAGMIVLHIIVQCTCTMMKPYFKANTKPMYSRNLIHTV